MSRFTFPIAVEYSRSAARLITSPLLGASLPKPPLPNSVDSAAIVAVTAITIATFLIGLIGVRVARTSSDFFVAARSISPLTNASAICGEYLSAASFLGFAGLLMRDGIDQVWFPVGYTAGYLVLMLFVAAPLRRFGAYTIPDFAEGRLDSVAARRTATVLVISISAVYLLPQMKGAGITLHAVSGAPYWVGVVVVGAVVSLNVALGGMKGITFVQAFQYWIKLAAIAIPSVWLGWHVLRHRPDMPASATNLWDNWSTPYKGRNPNVPNPLFRTYSQLLATLLGTMGLPHILVRFYTNPDGRRARRTTLLVLAMLSAFYLFPPIIAALGRGYAPDLLASGTTDTVVLVLPRRLLTGLSADLLSGIVAAGAFAAFLSTASGLMIAIAASVSQELLDGSTRGFRLGAVAAGLLAVVTGLQVARFDIGQLVAWAFALAAASFCPLLVLGIWWRGLTAKGAIAGLIIGGTLVSGAIGCNIVGLFSNGWPGTLLSYPAAWSVPVTFAVMIGVSLATGDDVPATTGQKLIALHGPEALGLGNDYRT